MPDKARKDAHYEALEQREALRQGITVDELRSREKEETIQYAMEALGLSREEVIAQSIHEYGRTYITLERRRRNLSTKRGKEVTHQELLDEDRKSVRESRFPGPDCLSTHECDIYDFSGELSSDRLEHAENCTFCSIMISMAENQRESRQIYESPAGPECFTKEELHELSETGSLPEGRRNHTATCKRCEMHYKGFREAWIEKTVPVPPLYTEEELMAMHSSFYPQDKKRLEHVPLWRKVWWFITEQ